MEWPISGWLSVAPGFLVGHTAAGDTSTRPSIPAAAKTSDLGSHHRPRRCDSSSHASPLEEKSHLLWKITVFWSRVRALGPLNVLASSLLGSWGGPPSDYEYIPVFFGVF